MSDITSNPSALVPGRPSQSAQQDTGANTMLKVVLGIAICVAVGAVAVNFGRPSATSASVADLLTHKVSKGKLSVTVTENGTVESSNNKEIKCMVKGGSTVLWVIETGTYVKPGDVLVRLDQSLIEDNILAQKIIYENALANKITAESDVAVAEKSITEYLEGTYVEERSAIEKEIFDAEQAYAQAKLTYESSVRMAAKGLIKSLQVAGDKHAVDSALKELELKKTKLTTLDKYKKEKEVQSLKSKLRADQAKLASYEASLKLEEARLEREKEQLKNCTIVADTEGMVIFPSMAEWKNTPDIEEGAVVREQQTLLMIPDVTQMQVKVGIHESKVDRLKVGMAAKVELQDLKLDGTVSEIAEVTRPAGWWTGNVVKYDTIITIQQYQGLKPGMSALVDVVLADYQDVLTIPVASILQDESGYHCWVKSDTGVSQRTITLGDTDDEYCIVDAGLKDGEVVVLNPLAYIDDAQKQALKPATPGGVEKRDDGSGDQTKEDSSPSGSTASK